MSELTAYPSSVLAPDRHAYRWLVFAVLLVGEVMDVLDANIINVAGPALEREMGATPAQLKWAIGGYALAMGAGLVVGGRLGDIYGKRRMFLAAMSGFALASLLCAAAPSIGILITGRFLQGAAGALLLPQGFALLRVIFRPDELAKAMAIFAPVLGCAAIAGPVIGGTIIEADVLGLGWRFALAVNLPIAAVALIMAWRFLPDDRLPKKASSLDIIGAGLMAVASGLLVLALIHGQETGWPLWTWLGLAASGAGFVAFALQQGRRAKSGRTPLVEPGIFRKKAFTVGILGMVLFFSAMIGMQLVLTLFLQLGQGFSAGEAGVAALPLATSAFIGSGLAGAILLERLGRKVLQLGALLQIGANALVWIPLERDGFSIWPLVPGLALNGLGAGLIIASLITIVISAVEDHEVGSGSGLLAAVQSISAAAGVAALGGLFFGSLSAGDAMHGFELALVLQATLLAGFFLLAFALPKRPTPEFTVSSTSH